MENTMAERKATPNTIIPKSNAYAPVLASFQFIVKQLP
jgi:hypothetical protein